LPVRSMWVLALAALTIFMLPFVWYVSNTFFTAFQTTGRQLISDLGTNDATTDSIDVFLTNGNKYVLVLSLIGVGFWVLVRTQKKGVPTYGY